MMNKQDESASICLDCGWISVCLPGEGDCRLRGLFSDWNRMHKEGRKAQGLAKPLVDTTT